MDSTEKVFRAHWDCFFSLSNPEVYDKLIKEGIIPHKRPELGIFDSDDIGKFIEKDNDQCTAFASDLELV